MAQTYCFGRFEVRPTERQLVADGLPLTIGQKAFDLLTVLCERRDRLVTKQELLDLAWQGRVVEENNLSVQVSSLRKILGSEAITTVPGLGYRFTVAMRDTPSASGLNRLRGFVSPQLHRRLVVLVHVALCGADSCQGADSNPAAKRIWHRLREELVHPTAEEAGGTVVSDADDRLCAMFDGAFDAVRWSLTVLKLIHDLALETPEQAIKVSAGVCLDDMVFDEGRPVGDSLKLAQALQALGSAGDIVMTDSVRSVIGRSLSLDLDDLGEQQLPFDAQARHLFKVRTELTSTRPADKAPRLAWQGRPAIAVLPFRSPATQGFESDRYFGEGVTEQIIASLSLNRSLLVISHNSTLRYADSATPQHVIAEELDVQYLLVGSVLRNGEKLRVHTELVDAATQAMVWSQHFIGEASDVFDFQEEIASKIAAAINPRLHDAELARLRKRPTDNLSAYDHVLRGVSLLNNLHESDFRAAGNQFQRAIVADSEYAQAYGYLAWWHNLRYGEQRGDRLQDDARLADRHSLRAVELDPHDAQVLAIAGHIQSFINKRFEHGLDLLDQALTVNPNCAFAWARCGSTLAYLGRGDEALERIRCAMRLSPMDQQNYSFFTTNGIASLVAGRLGDAVVWLKRARRLNPRYKAATRMLIPALAMIGELDECKVLADEFLKQEPQFSVQAFGRWYPLQQPYLADVLQGMQMAGLPD